MTYLKILLQVFVLVMTISSLLTFFVALMGVMGGYDSDYCDTEFNFIVCIISCIVFIFLLSSIIYWGQSGGGLL